ncbi:hypothetical protein CEB3_c44550 [Peptococcaceae bacterium CEB3]|nr:hypothetical protein CEB3_c44550 [Peptococcaceae bacterium CEB3]
MPEEILSFPRPHTYAYPCVRLTTIFRALRQDESSLFNQGAVQLFPSALAQDFESVAWTQRFAVGPVSKPIWARAVAEAATSSEAEPI